MKLTTFIFICFVCSVATAKDFSSSQDEYEYFLKQKQFSNLENREIKGIEILIASAGKKIESKWGHASLRFVDSDNNPFNDVVIAFVADLEGKEINYIDGIKGQYNLSIEMKSMLKYLRINGIDMLREVNSYIIPSSKKSRRILISNLKKYFFNEYSDQKYRFFSNNCASALQKLLIDSELWNGIELTQKPVNIPKTLRKFAISPLPRSFRFSPELFLSEQVIKKLPKELQVYVKALTIKDFNRNIDNTIITKIGVRSLPEKTLKLILPFIIDDYIDPEIKELIEEVRFNRDIKVTYDDYFIIKSVSEEFYDLSANYDDDLLKDNWSKTDLEINCKLHSKIKYILPSSVPRESNSQLLIYNYTNFYNFYCQ